MSDRLISAKQSRTKGFPNVEGKFGAASRDAFLDDGARARGTVPLTHGEGIRNADAVAFSGEGLEHPEPLPKILTLTLEHGAAGLAS